MKGACSEPGCSTEAKLRGLCQRHYDRARYNGSIEVRPCAARNARRAFLLKHQKTSTDECVLWPYGLDSDGYGQMFWNGVSMTASRAMCLLAHGAPSPPNAEAAHRCGDPACINPNHIRWATPRENHADKRLHGTLAIGERHGRAKLTENDVRSIRTSRKSLSDLARQYGVSAAAVRMAQSGKTWGHVDAVA